MLQPALFLDVMTRALDTYTVKSLYREFLQHTTAETADNIRTAPQRVYNDICTYGQTLQHFGKHIYSFVIHKILQHYTVIVLQ